MDPVHEMKSHEQTYGGFIGLIKWSVPLVAAIALLVVVLIA